MMPHSEQSQVHQKLQQLSVSPQLPLPLNQPQWPHMRKEQTGVTALSPIREVYMLGGMWRKWRKRWKRVQMTCESAETQATESEGEEVERNSEEDGLNTERARKTTERQEEQQADVQERLCSLAMLSIESQLARKLDFKDLISDFAHEKARRWAFGEKS
ncbi:unnamed protein product [Pleuronectes platessa]|uniref:Uncharacterized protein n=1 Tax=Pleuronectes platessa TaxID=8262 RepID=A0A9N7UF71_PLEPL|nr:unnamed protein product [Pleuronectes platessa]